MKILFVVPSCGKIAKKYLAPSLGIGILAGLSNGHEIKIVDGNIEKVNIEKKWDVVAITASTPAVKSAFEIADAFRIIGITVVMGGVHPTVMPEECLQHADAVCIGEGEKTWPLLLNDLENGNLKERYIPETVMNPIVLPEIPRYLFPKKGYLIRDTVLMSRGCPNKCEFCLVKKIYGPGYRVRTMDDIVNEIAGLRKGNRPIVFVDDNIVGDKKFSKEFFTKLIPLKIHWMSQCSLNIADDDELLNLAKQSGCMGLFIGFESINDDNLKDYKKTVNQAQQFKSKIEKIHSKKIFIQGSFIFGFEKDTVESFQKTVDFAIDVKLAAANFGILVPYPGTPLFQRYKSEGRIFDYDWSHYDAAHVVFKLDNMTVRQLQEGQYYAMKKFYSIRSIFTRIGTSFTPFLWVLNISQTNIVKELKKIVKESNFD